MKKFSIISVLGLIAAVLAVQASASPGSPGPSSYDPCIGISLDEATKAMKEDPNFGGVTEVRALTRGEEYEVKYRFRDECTGAVIVQVKLANAGKTCSVVSSDSNSYAYDCR